VKAPVIQGDHAFSGSVGGWIRINFVTADELVKLPGITIAQAIGIVDERKNNGYFSGPDDFRKRLAAHGSNLTIHIPSLDFSRPTG